MKTMLRELTEQQERLVSLVEEGYVRWKIAEIMGISESRAREMIRTLCARYDCRMEELPRAVARAAENADNPDNWEEY